MDSTFFHYVARVESMVKVSFETVFSIFCEAELYGQYLKIENCWHGRVF